MKEIKEKPTKRVPRSNAAGKIPKAALKKAWTEAKEKKPNHAAREALLRRETVIIQLRKIPARW